MTDRQGFATVVGRPNAGKSTLVNALVGQKVAIISPAANTTRHAIRGIVRRDGLELVLVDTPGLHKPRTLLGQRLDEIARDALDGVDVVLLIIAADQPIGSGDRRVAADAASARRPIVVVVTKTDRVDADTVALRLTEAAALVDAAAIVPVSAHAGFQLDTLVAVVADLLPEGPAMFPDGQATDMPLELRLAEAVREAALDGVRDELPHSIAVTVDELDLDPPTARVYVTIHVERDSQKAIVIGARGSRMKAVGTTARADVEAILGRSVYLDVHVRVAKDWQRDPKALRRLGL
jgi:GTPase